MLALPARRPAALQASRWGLFQLFKREYSLVWGRKKSKKREPNLILPPRDAAHECDFQETSF